MDSVLSAMDVTNEIYVSLKDIILTLAVQPWEEIRWIQEENIIKIKMKAWLWNEEEIKATAATSKVLNSCAATKLDKEDISTLVNLMTKETEDHAKKSLYGYKSPASKPSSTGSNRRENHQYQGRNHYPSPHATNNTSASINKNRENQDHSAP